MERRREALGRNRRGPATKNLVPTFLALAGLIAGGGWLTYDYFTKPQRVLGAKQLGCSATEISWTRNPKEPTRFTIAGCGKSIDAECPPKEACVELDEF